ncbi:hypothetical protein DFS34DRAFT_630017 [Phlyctochytrium arcticum]|nr:hypothetical protein DFS34DRAFT_630017 [Phlyctochytrium arcticum]
MTLVGGTGVIVTPTGTGYSISSIDTLTQEKAEDAPNEETTEGSEGKVLKNGGDIIQVTGGLAGALSGLGGILGGSSAIGSASSAIGAIAGSGGLLLGAAATGGFISIFGRRRERKEDTNGDPILDSDGNIDLEPGSNVVIVTMPDNTGCDATRLLFDTPPSCSYLGIAGEYKQQAINLEMLRQYDSQIIQPSTALLESIEGDLNNNYQTKISGVLTCRILIHLLQPKSHNQYTIFGRRQLIHLFRQSKIQSLVFCHCLVWTRLQLHF